MKTILNILWIAFVGGWSAIGWLFTGALLVVTVVGAPFGRQCFKFARFTFWPFGRVAIASPTAITGSIIGNILWFIPGALLALGYVIGGFLLCITVIGIPFGVQSFKLAGLALSPFGKEIVRTKDLRSGAWVQAKAAQQPQMAPNPTAPPVAQVEPPNVAPLAVPSVQAVPATSSAPQGGASEMGLKLAKLDNMHAEGLLTDDEFNAARQRVVDGSSPQPPDDPKPSPFSSNL